MHFKDIVGKDEIKRNLVKTVKNSRIPHAQIFLGKEGTGGLATALAFASYIMCENKSEDDSCGLCNQCIKSHKFIHPDIHFSFPVVKFGEKKREITTSDDFLPKWREILFKNPYMNTSEWLDHIGAENSLPNINVKECNDIIHKLNMMSYESENKVLVLWLPEYLGTEGNRLLKLIEEPTENTYIILVSENQDQILQTILSRCQLVKLPAFENEEICRFLEEQMGLPHEKADQISNQADGNINLAINIGKNEVNDYSELLLEWLRSAFRSDPIQINKWITEVSNLNKDEQKNFFEYGLHFFRQFVFRSLTKMDSVNLTEKELDSAKKMSSIINVDLSEKIVHLLNEATENVSRNINIKIMLFADTLAIGKEMRKK